MINERTNLEGGIVDELNIEEMEEVIAPGLILAE